MYLKLFCFRILKEKLIPNNPFRKRHKEKMGGLKRYPLQFYPFKACPSSRWLGGYIGFCLKN
jgi:hypothetical protein